MVGLSLGLSTEFTAVQGYKSLVSHLLHTKLFRNECMNIMQFFLRFYTGLYNYKSISTLRYGKQVAKEFWLVNAASPPMELALILEVSVDPPRITALTLPARCCAMAPATDRLWSKGGCYRRDRRTDWRTDTRPLHRPCTANYSGSVNNAFLHAIRAAISYISIKIVAYPGYSRQHASRL